MKRFLIQLARLVSPGLLGAVLTFASSSVACAQYSIQRYSFSTAIGSPSAGGSFSLSSTVGAAGSGATVSGGSFSVTGTPWMLAVIETPGAPQLTIGAANGVVQVSWPSPSSGWVLQQNTNNVSSGNWTNVTAALQDDGTTKTFIIDLPAGNRFYRLFKP